MGLAVVGSQVVGLVPLKAMLQAAEHYAAKENLFLLEEDQKIRLVVDRLGLHSVGAFNPKERVIELVRSKAAYFISIQSRACIIHIIHKVAPRRRNGTIVMRSR